MNRIWQTSRLSAWTASGDAVLKRARRIVFSYRGSISGMALISRTPAYPCFCIVSIAEPIYLLYDAICSSSSVFLSVLLVKATLIAE